MLIALDRQHGGKPRNFADPGAWYDIDGDGQSEQHEAEARLIRWVLLGLEDRLLELEHQVVCLADGKYSDRWARAHGYGCALYLAPHLNAGARRGLVVHDPRSTRGHKLALHVADALALACPELGEPWTSRVNVDTTDRYPRAKTCIGGLFDLKPVGLLIEPCSVNVSSHRELLEPDRLVEVGRAIASGVDGYAKTKAS